jgi:hypothetical protein
MFKWVPCRGPSAEAVGRMRAHFTKPSEPMGEAWFLSEERYIYTGLAERPLSETTTEELCNVLWEISGTSSFGRRDEWDEWFKYLLPELVARSHEYSISDALLETTVSTFMILFPKGLEDVYAGFREDALATLGACLLKPELWDCGGDAEGERARLRSRTRASAGTTRSGSNRPTSRAGLRATCTSPSTTCATFCRA